MRSFFLSILFRAYLVPVFNVLGFGLAKATFEEIDMG